jgi:hypothetical protein
MADTDIISDRKMAQSFSAFWQELTPLGDAYIRAINLQKDRLGTPLKSELPGDRRGLVNELSFRLFRYSVEMGRSPDANAVRVIEDSVRIFIQRLPRMGKDVGNLNEMEREEASALAERMFAAFGADDADHSLLIGPRFKGCGRLLACEGDVLQKTILWEVKAGERDFRVADLRQLLVYCALNDVGGDHQIESIGVYNPRSAVCFRESIPTVCERIAGRPPGDLFFEIQQFLCSDVSSV